MTDLPTGTVTFLFTDIEGSTDLAQQYPAAMPALLARHHAILYQAIETHHGHVFQITGDAFSAAFFTAPDALQAALDAQRGLHQEGWQPAPIKVRMGINTGAAQAGGTEERAGGYVGYSTLARAQRVMSTAYGGQVLLSNASAELARGDLPKGVTLQDLGEHRLKGLLNLEHLWQLVAPDLTQDFPPLKSLNAIPNNLPIQLTSFVGREKEIAAVTHSLTTTRLLTLTGSGGTGKTRLSLHVAADVLEAYPNGVWLIELAQLTDPTLIPQSIAATLGVRETPGRPPMVALTDYLREKKLLLILDNCEHLIDACAQLADHLLHTCPHLKILASSREALGIAGETAFRVPSLSLPSPHPTPVDLQRCEAARLFIERASTLKPDFSVTPQNAPGIAQICLRLDGIPLALELAAARVNVLTVEQIAVRLDDRFRLLSGGSRTALPRQQTLRAAIDWSYDLLSDPERTLLRRLSVFVGGWTFEAAESVCGSAEYDVLDLLSHLVAKSLVVFDERDQAARYRMLEMVRQYARDKLLASGEAAQLRGRHLDNFAAFVKEAEQELDGADMPAWIKRLEVEHDNIRAALEWSLNSDPDMALDLAGSLTRFWSRRGYGTEGRQWLHTALERVEVLPPLEGDAAQRRLVARTRAIRGLGTLANAQGESGFARAQVETALALARQTGDDFLIADTLIELGTTIRLAGDLTGAESALTESLALLRKLGERRRIAYVLVQLAGVAGFLGKREASRAYVEESVRLSRGAYVPWDSALSFLVLGQVMRAQGDYLEARTQLRQAQAVFLEMEDKLLFNVAQSQLAETLRLEGNYVEAVSLYKKTMVIWRELGHRGGLARCLEVLAFLAISQTPSSNGESSVYLIRAARLLGAAEALREASQSEMTPEEQSEYDGEVPALRAKLDPVTFNAAWAEGRAMSLEQAVEYALKEV